MEFSDYLQKLGDSVSSRISPQHLADFQSKGHDQILFPKTTLEQDTATLANLSTEQLESLYTYKVPKLGPNGSCSISKEYEPLPFDLGKEILNANWRDHSSAIASPHTLRLLKLKSLMVTVQEITKVDWIGVYRTINLASESEPFLVKEAYVGAPSRAKFPLTSEFATMSNNSWVGINGKAKIVQDTGTYEGPYYICDARVKSELCAPIFSADGTKVIGIIDAESFISGFFDNIDHLLLILYTCYILGRESGN